MLTATWAGFRVLSGSTIATDIRIPRAVSADQKVKLESRRDKGMEGRGEGDYNLLKRPCI